MSEYFLGHDDPEIERLRLQHEVWGGTTRAFLARLGVGPGWRVLDLGAGPGFVALELGGLVGPAGSVVALDASAQGLAHLERAARASGRGWITARCARLEAAGFEPASFDLVFARWFWSFVPRADEELARAATWLRPGGVLAFQDYDHEGISLFPESAGFRAAVRATRAWYARAGGDAFVAGRALALFRAAGLEPVELRPNVLCGPPGSPPFRWADAFFPRFSADMERAGLLTADERAQFLREWAERKADPTALFFSPIVLDAAARRP